MLSREKYLQVDKLGFDYNGQVILDNASLAIGKGDFVFFTGPNGSGKTTLAKLILNLLEPSSGTLTFRGQQLTETIVAKEFGYVPQYTRIDRSFPISVREVIELECQGVRAHCNREPVEHLHLLNSERLIERNLSELSGGEFQRVLIARSLVKDPEVLVLDEPVNNLDMATQASLFELLLDLNKRGKTIIAIVHDHNVIEQIERARTFLFGSRGVREVDAATELHQHN